MIIRAIKADITKLKVDAIVNAANSSLLGGSGVDGAIHRAAGPDLYLECIRLNGCKTGEAKITKAYRLPSNFIIHTVGPVWQGGAHQESEKLSSCYERCLELAINHEIRSLAFPCISTGIYRFPQVQAAEIALDVSNRFQDSDIQEVIFCCFSDEDLNIYFSLLDRGNPKKIDAPEE